MNTPRLIFRAPLTIAMTAAMLAFIVMLATLPIEHGQAAETTRPAIDISAVDALVKEFGDRLERSRYMASGGGSDAALPGWEGFPTKRYTYSVRDKDGSSKSADVVMLNASPTQISTWIVSAIAEVKGAYDQAAGKELFAHIIAQSGGQFPVAGVVYEDILPADGVNETFCFRDGVTVAVEGVEHRGTQPLTNAEIEASMRGKVTRVYQFARIASTSPQMWIDAGGAKDVLGDDGKPTQKWLDVVRTEYQKAWTSDRNALIAAWVKAKLASTKPATR